MKSPQKIPFNQTPQKKIQRLDEQRAEQARNNNQLTPNSAFLKYYEVSPVHMHIQSSPFTKFQPPVQHNLLSSWMNDLTPSPNRAQSKFELPNFMGVGRQLNKDFEDSDIKFPPSARNQEKIDRILLINNIILQRNPSIKNNYRQRDEDISNNIEAYQNENEQSSFGCEEGGRSIQTVKKSYHQEIASIPITTNFYTLRKVPPTKELFTPKQENRELFADRSKFKETHTHTQKKVISINSSTDNNNKITCTCKKSRCIKLYCECFAAGQICKDCNCVSCANNQENEDERIQSMHYHREKDPNAFKSKVEKQVEVYGESLQHSKGCNCKKSFCNKKYCECFQAGVKCTDKCKCDLCKNGKVCQHDDNLPNQSTIESSLSFHDEIPKRNNELSVSRKKTKSNSHIQNNILRENDYSRPYQSYAKDSSRNLNPEINTHQIQFLQDSTKLKQKNTSRKSFITAKKANQL